MAVSLPARRLELIEQIANAVRARRADRAPRWSASIERAWLRSYFRGVDEQDLARRPAAHWVALARAHAALGARRLRGEPIVQLFDPGFAGAGFDSPHSFVAVVTDDMPFLVDSLGIVFNSAAVGVHLLVHPVFDAHRSARGELLSAGNGAAGAPSVTRTSASQLRESWQLFEIDRQIDSVRIATLESALRAALRDVRCVVEDWRPMRERVARLARELRANPPAAVPPREAAESASLLDWIAAEHFVLMGYRYYRLVRGAQKDHLVPDRQAGAGLLRRGAGAAPEGMASALPLRGAQRAAARDARAVLVITKADALSSVHRAAQLDYVGVKQYDARGRVHGEHRFVGLWTSTAYFASPRDIPLLRLKVSQIIEGFGLDAASHDGKAVLAVLETYPRDELFQASAAQLMDLIRGVVNLYERRTTRLLARRDAFGRFWSFMVYVPRDRYTTEVRQRIERLLLEACAGTGLDSQVQIAESNHARVHVVVRTPADEGARAVASLDLHALEASIARAATTWADRLAEALFAAFEPDRAAALAERYRDAFPLAYQDEVEPAAALEDVADLEAIDAANPLRLNLHRPAGAAATRVRLKFARRGEPIPVSDLLPMLENFGLRVISERPYSIALPNAKASIQDFEFELRGERALDIARVEQEFTATFLAVWRGELDDDGFNRLLLLAGLTGREVLVLRACARYLLQTGLPYSQVYMERALAAHPQIARELVQLFRVRFDPELGRSTASRRIVRASAARDGASARAREEQAIVASIQRRLDGISRADEDRMLRGFLALVRAMLRTNAYQAGPPRALAFKLDPQRVPDLPLPRPAFEIFVHSTRVEGVHLRKGRVARGGIRWSDRYEDFRTEILGLMKAQNVKNTLIVPAGAKGGFVPRRLALADTREQVQRAGIEAYREFIGALLDLTDDLERGERVRPPPRVLRHDGDDPYLVVAADKGTATFSDVANAIAVERGFWLGDAFASGGSAGYDHKKMGITARGAWECVKRHFRELGVDIHSAPFTVAGIGDMSGDVFGNGMLLSPQIRLVAAFNHQHVFIDPDPEPARSLRERRRLFALPRSTWADYDRRALSKGGDIYERSAKSVSISAEARAALGIEGAVATPNELIRAILRSRVDLLWNGGIGTYVKASDESHAAAGDRANDAVRIDGRELRARVVGEGGNLGLTQRGRIEYALAGGRLNTDFIDNSAGVNTSDVEVNLKILMAPVERRGRLSRGARNRLLASASEDVAALVLRNNYLQSQALSLLEADGARRLPELQHLIRALERAGQLDRSVEFLPDDETLTERQAQSLGLTRPELAVVLAYSKIALSEQLLDSDLPEDPYFSGELERYFPAAIRRRLRNAIPRHRLRREIVTTAITNSLVNRMGPAFVMQAMENAGASAAQVARAYAIARESFAMRRSWDAIEALDNRVPSATQYALHRATARLLEDATYWLLRRRRRALAVHASVRELAPLVAPLAESIETALRGLDLERYQSTLAGYREAGVPDALARRVSRAQALHCALDLAEASRLHRLGVLECARVWFEIGEALGLDWLDAQIERLEVDGAWHAVARAGLRDSATSLRRSLVDRVLRRRPRGAALTRSVALFLQDSQQEIAAWQRMLAEMKAAAVPDFATLSVGVESVRKLVS